MATLPMTNLHWPHHSICIGRITRSAPSLNQHWPHHSAPCARTLPSLLNPLASPNQNVCLLAMCAAAIKFCKLAVLRACCLTLLRQRQPRRLVRGPLQGKQKVAHRGKQQQQQHRVQQRRQRTAQGSRT